MPLQNLSSRRRFVEYKQQSKGRGADAESGSNSLGTQPAGTPSSGRSFTRLLREFWQLVRGQRLAIAFALGTQSVATLFHLLPPAATKITIDYVLTDRPLPSNVRQWLHLPGDRGHLLIFVAAAVVVVSLVGSAVALWGRWHATRATKRVQVAVRRRVFEHAVRLPLHRVYQLKSGGVASMLREDAGDTAELIFSMLYNPWRAILQLLASLAVLAWVDWRLLLGSLVLFPSVFATHRTWISRIRPLHRDIRKQRQDVDGHATEAFGGMRVVRAFGRQRSETARFVRGNHLLARQELHAWGWARTVEVIWAVLLPLASAALMLYGGWQVLGGQLSLGDLMMFLAYLMMLLGPLETLANSATQFQGSLAALDRVLDLLAEPPEMPAAPTAVAVQREQVTGHIALRNVGFCYPGSIAFVLRDVSFDVSPGEMIALVGRSGAGKTTLSNLIARFFDPTEGAIELDGVDLRSMDVYSYRRVLGIVEQEVFLFDGTVAENIAYASRHATPQDIERAARVASAHEFIVALENGYDTLIGERGVRLSGGERQRLAIARAVLADPRILILDEATSNLDTDSEQLIQQGLHRLLRGRTAFVMAHRLSTIAHADRIVVLDGGRIVELGTHAELMSASGRYRHMVRVQTGADRQTEDP